MSDTYPVVELVRQALVSCLEAISVDAGYHIDVPKVHQPVRRGIDGMPGNYEIVVVQAAAEAAGEEAIGTEEFVQDFLVDLVVRPPDGEQKPFDQIANIFAADVRKALHADRTLGGVAIDTTAGPPEQLIGDEGTYDGVGLTVRCRYRTDADDPYTQQ